MPKSSSFHPPRLMTLCAVALIAVSCTPPTPDADYQKTYPVTAELETFRLKIDFVRAGAAAADADLDGFRLFVRDFLRRSRSPMLVTTRSAMRRPLRALLVREGVSSGNVMFRAAAKTQVGAVLEFRGYGIKVPECGDWSGWAATDPSNAPHTNFGCAYQRNIGLMLSDPGDLRHRRPVDSMDAQRNEQVLKTFREGTPAGAQPPRGEEGVISDIK